MQMYGPPYGPNEDLGGLGEAMQITRARGHHSGGSCEARGNRWADQAARQGRDLRAPESSATRAMRAAS
eukprot:8949405-Pyramimonas_sp.AAC.1